MNHVFDTASCFFSPATATSPLGLLNSQTRTAMLSILLPESAFYFAESSVYLADRKHSIKRNFLQHLPGLPGCEQQACKCGRG
ncbi:hypothetical protein ABBQ38_000382 [Trebouxia sp. C0009 RCD-2024]